MDSLVMVAYTFSITVGLPLGDIASVSIEGGAEAPGERSSVAKLGISDEDVTNRIRSESATLGDVINRSGDSSAMTSSVKSDLEATPVGLEEDEERVTSLLIRSFSSSFDRETGQGETSQKTQLQETDSGSFHSSNSMSLVTTPLLQVKTLDDEALRGHSAIVEALEKLGVLESDGKWCYSLERISKSLMPPSSDSPSSLWTVELLIEAKPAIFRSLPSSSHGDRSKSAPRAMLVGRGSDVTATNTVTTSGGDGLTGATSERESDGLYGHRDSSSIPRAKTKLTQRNERDENSAAPRPNRTQILVISTCSSVIGVFFAVALIMRIRNHLRRTRSLKMRRVGVRRRQAHVTSGPRVTSSASACSLAGAAPREANQKENIGGIKEEGVHTPTVPSPGTLFRRRWSSGQRRVGPSSTPRLPLFRRRSELTRLFVSERREREAAKQYFRQLSLTCPSNALFVGCETLADEAEMTSPAAARTTSADVATTFSRRWENFHRLDIV